MGSSLDIRLVVQEKFAHLGMTEKARTMKGSTAAAQYGIRKIEHGAGGARAIGSAGVQKGVILLVCLANAARVCDTMIFQEIEITVLRRLENVGLARNASSSSSLETHVSSGKGR